MAPKNVFAAIVCVLLPLAWSGLSMADEYKAGELLGLDLSKAVLSPKPLGPPAEFAPVPIEARADRVSEGAPARAERVTHPKIRMAHLRNEKPRTAAHTRPARGHGNPFDAQASDTRIQVWPCKSGGIRNWQR